MSKPAGLSEALDRPVSAAQEEGIWTRVVTYELLLFDDF